MSNFFTDAAPANAAGYPRIGFKVGTLSALNAIITNSTATHGTFYLTSDTHRLYIGNENGSLSPVNLGITSVATLSAALSSSPNYGDFYYLTGSNVLAIYAGYDSTNGHKWILVNTNTSVASVAYAVTNTDTTHGNVQFTVTDSDTNPISDNYNIVTSGGLTLDTSNDSKTLTLTGNTSSVSTVAGDANSNSAKIHIANSNSTSASDAVLKGGSNVTITRNNTSGDIEIAATDTNTTNSSLNSKAGAYGSSTDIEGFGILITDSENDTVSTKIDPIITYGGAIANNDTATTGTVHFENGTAQLNVYTKYLVEQRIEDQLKLFDAMHYMGIKSTKAALPTTGVRVGDTWMLSADDGTDHAGTIYIARGTEVDGVIVGTIEWDTVNSSAIDTTYSWTPNANHLGFTVMDDLNNPKFTETFASGDTGTTGISVTGTGTDGVDGTNTITIGHKAVTLSTPTAAAWTLTLNGGTERLGGNTAVVVTGLTGDGKGHITGYTTASITLNSELPNIQAVAFGDVLNPNDTKTTVSGTTATVSLGYKVTDGTNINHASNSFNVTSQSLRLDTISGANGVSLEFVWGSF